jgi:hypothetical protein
MTDKTPSFVQSLHKMTSHLFVENPAESIDFIGDGHLSPGRTAKIAPHFPQRNDAARRFDCPAFRRALETGQTNRCNRNLYGRAINGRFLNSATPQPFRRLGSQKTPAQCE